MASGGASACAVQVLAHRGWGSSGVGCRAKVPENSVAAFARAAAHPRVAGAELDVWLTKDEKVVVIHGGGPSERGLLCETTVVSSSFGKGVEQLTLAELEECCGIFLKDAWLLVKEQRDSSSDHCADFHSLSTSQQQVIRDAWRGEKVRCRRGSKIPLLAEVLQEFSGKLIFNVELKGTKPALGPKVLEIAARFPGTVTRISSIRWIAPAGIQLASLPPSPPRRPEDVGKGEDDDSHFPSPVATRVLSPRTPHSQDPSYFVEQLASEGELGGGETDPDQIVDLLEHLVGNSLEIPLALLFNRDLPDASAVIECLRRYKAKWVHIRYDSWKYMTVKEIESPSAKELMASFVDDMHKNGVQVMTWWSSRSLDSAPDIRLSLEAGVDSLCPNDAELAADIVAAFDEDRRCASSN